MISTGHCKFVLAVDLFECFPNVMMCNFTIGGDKKVSYSLEFKVFFTLPEVDEVLLIYILPSTIITEVSYRFIWG